MPDNILSSREINSISESIIVKILITTVDQIFHGSGVIVDKNGTRYSVITAWHCLESVKPDDKVHIHISEQEYFAGIYDSIKQIGQVDVGLIEFTSLCDFKTAQIGSSSKIERGDSIWVAGFSGVSYCYDLRLAPGFIIALSKKQNQSITHILYDNHSTGGMSGGAVLDCAATLIGIHVSRELLQNEKNESTGAKFGVPIDFYSEYLREESATLAEDTYSSKHNSHAIIKQRLIPQPVASKVVSARDLIELGWKYWKENDFENAKIFFDKAVEQDSYSAFTWSNRAKFWNQSGEWALAICDLKQASLIDPNNISLINLSAVCHAVLCNHEEALAFFMAAQQIAPNSGTHNFSVGNALMHLNRYSDALVYLSNAINADQASDAYFTARGISNFNLKLYSTAILDFTSAISLVKRDSTYYRRALTYRELGEFELAIADIKFALEIDPEDYRFYLLSGQIKYSNLLSYQQALIDLHKALLFCPLSENDNIHAEIGNVYMLQNSFESLELAIDSYAEALEFNPLNSAAYWGASSAMLILFGESKCVGEFVQTSAALGNDNAIAYLSSEEGRWC